MGNKMRDCMNTEYWDAQIRGYAETFKEKKKLRLDRLLKRYWEEE